MGHVFSRGAGDTSHDRAFAANLMTRVRVLGSALVAAAVLVGCAQTPTPAPSPTQTLSSAPPPAAPATPSGVTPSIAPPAATVSSAAPNSPSVADVPARAAPVLDPRQVATSEALTPSGRSRYACEQNGALTDIHLPEGSGRICSRFPAMGPCQYERNACRARGGRVIRFDGVEITRDVEREYDKQVQRYRLNAG